MLSGSIYRSLILCLFTNFLLQLLRVALLLMLTLGSFCITLEFQLAFSFDQDKSLANKRSYYWRSCLDQDSFGVRQAVATWFPEVSAEPQPTRNTRRDSWRTSSPIQHILTAKSLKYCICTAPVRTPPPPQGFCTCLIVALFCLGYRQSPGAETTDHESVSDSSLIQDWVALTQSRGRGKIVQ